MPEYLAPGVYVEETGARPRRIDGVSTSTAGFVGPTRTGPTSGVSGIVTSFGEFEGVYGGLEPLTFANEQPTPNYLAQGVRAYFENGGQRLYVSRVYEAIDGSDGRASAILGSASDGISLTARFPGAVPLQVTFILLAGSHALALDAASGRRRLRGVNAFDLVHVTDGGVPMGAADGFHWAEPLSEPADPSEPRWQLFDTDNGPGTAEHALPPTAEVRMVSLAVEIGWVGSDGRVTRRALWDGLGTHAKHRRALSRVFTASLTDRTQETTAPVVIDTGPLDAAAVARLLLSQAPREPLAVSSPPSGGFSPVRSTVLLSNGRDGVRPSVNAYTGSGTAAAGRTGLQALEEPADISIVAAPGYSAGWSAEGSAESVRMLGIALALIDHCERMRYRIAVLDSANGQGISDVRALRARLQSAHAVLYYPWVRAADAATGGALLLPPCGFVAGIYARNDVERGVHKAPANEVVRGAIGLELMLNTAQQEVLNPEGINTLRWFEGRGYRVWGARTISAAPECTYVNLRRYLAYLEHSIDRGIRWVVFETNGEPLWANVRRTIEDFLYREWASGRLPGEKPAQGYFVRCDRSTMTGSDLDNGRLVCLVGVAPLRPAEFMTMRIGQWTADRRT